MSNIRVLIVDDVDTNRVVLSGFLSHYKFQIDLAASGQDALRLARRNKYDIIFMDCQMPGMDGYQCTMKIREELGTNCPPIIAVTAATSPADMEKCKAAGMKGMIPKPIQLKAVVSALGRLGVHVQDQKKAA